MLAVSIVLGAAIGLLAAEQVLEWSAYGNLITREGNRSPLAAPQGLYPCAGGEPGMERWLAISVASDDQWRALGKALGGASGGYTSGRQEGIDILRQRSRPYLFSNTVAPPIVGASMKTLLIMRHAKSDYVRMSWTTWP